MSADESTGDPHVLAPGRAPSPFTADEIRRGCPPGRTIRLLVATASGDAWERVNRFTDCDDEGAVIESWRVGSDGRPAGPVERRRSTWLELQGHASFPSEVTSIEPETIELPVGAVECLRYTVDSGPGAVTFWFSVAHPGMPVRWVAPGEDGGLDTTTMVASEMP
jgi:hypothetical protein